MSGYLFPDAEPFNLFVVDPPWSHDNFGQRGHGASKAVYDELPDEALAAMPVSRVAARDSVCVLWCSRTALAEGRGAELLRAWDFRPVTTAFAWVKVYPSGKPYCGLGSYSRSGLEVALLGIRGSCPRGDEATAVLEVVTAPLEARPVGEAGELDRHSSKPEAVLERVEHLWPTLTRRLELFARRRRPGWHAWGAEAPSCDFVFGPEVGSVWKWSPCTGVAASWCPVCGDCTCDRNEFGERYLEDEPESTHADCPLHRRESRHAAASAARRVIA